VKRSKNISYLALIAGIAALIFGAVYLRIVRTQEHNQAVAPTLAPGRCIARLLNKKRSPAVFSLWQPKEQIPR
jgi:hypothetical protein